MNNEFCGELISNLISQIIFKKQRYRIINFLVLFILTNAKIFLELSA